jgi:tRNA 2-selenouridine synthase
LISTWNDPELTELFARQTPLIDVRAPIEFAEGAIPFSVNLPLMNNEERQRVGICYKQHGQAAAIKLGHELVNGEIKQQRIQAWTQYLKLHPEARVFCFRGGLRSQTSCQWITEAGIPTTPLSGGYKRLRQFFLQTLQEAPLPPLIRLGGLTGSGKTPLLNSLPNSIDLEELALHRGSAFGDRGVQPSQISFENQLALKLLPKNPCFFVEDESYSLGKILLPQRFFRHLRQSPLVVLETTLEERIRNIYHDYVLTHEAIFFLNSVEMLGRKLGGLRTKTLNEMIKQAFSQGTGHEEWITILLTEYYDPIYLRDLEKQKALILFTGDAEQITEWANAERTRAHLRGSLRP